MKKGKNANEKDKKSNFTVSIKSLQGLFKS